MNSLLAWPRRRGAHTYLVAAGVVLVSLGVGLALTVPFGQGPGRWLAVAAVQVSATVALVALAGLARPGTTDPRGTTAPAAERPAPARRVGLEPGSTPPALLAAVELAPGTTASGYPAAVDTALARLHFDGRLERALDAVRHEDELLEVTGRAAESLLPAAATELLLVGARGSTMVQATESGPDGEGPGCPVPTAGECEAIRTGQTRRYEASSGFDACPHLRGRTSGPCSAVCVPVRVLGRSIGVVHRTGPVGQPPPSEVVASLESLASKAGARLSVLRAAGAEVSSALDAGTGALDRPSIEARVLDLARNLTPFSLAQADVDHFELYIRTFGAPSAERALRLLAATLAEVLRPADLVGRFGDDEFLVVLPHASQGEASRALERVREHLALRLAASTLPKFTVSFGVVESAFGQTLDELLVAADIAVSLAKDLGRNRVVVASEQLIDPLVDGDL
jgi:diguanylate cyclase (GGDEF)-like protein